MCTRPDRPRTPARRRAQAGVTLVELIVALTLAGVLLGAVWSAWTTLGRASADPLVSRQALAVAQSLLREIDLQPLPGDATAAATPGRTGYASIADYDGLAMTGITDVEGAAVAGLEGYNASVRVRNLGFEGVPAASAWWIEVTVTTPDGQSVKLAQWRTQR